MAGIRVEGNTSGNVAEVDANNNLKANLPTTLAQAGFATVAFEKDAGAITGTRHLLIPDISHYKRLGIALDTPWATYNFTPTTQNTGDFKHAFSTMTMTQSGGFLNVNPALATASGNYAYLQTWRHFSLWTEGGINCEFTYQISAMPPSNQILEAGFFIGTAGTVPADGAFFRLTSTGLKGVISYSGVETQTGVLIASVAPNDNSRLKICICQESVEFWVDGVLGEKIMVPAGNAIPYLMIALPQCIMMRNSGTVTGGHVAKFGNATVIQLDLNLGRKWSEIMGGQGNAYQGQEGDTMGSLAMYSNAALAAAAALTNTTAAAGNLGLGGVVLVAPTLAAGTDGILLSYANPAGSVTQPPKTLIVNGVSISSSVQAALTGGPLSLVFGAAYGHTAVSLATAETGSFVTATTKAPRRVPLGTQSYVVTAAAGVGAVDIVRRFVSPIVVNPGEFFAITCRNVGTVTSAGAIVIAACVDHYFE